MSRRGSKEEEEEPKATTRNSGGNEYKAEIEKARKEIGELQGKEAKEGEPSIADQTSTLNNKIAQLTSEASRKGVSLQ